MILYDLAEHLYHARPELSSTQARRILESPAKFHYGLTHPEEPKKAWDLGTAVHSKVLGTGAETVTVPVELLAKNGAASTNAAKEWIEQARAEGKTPVSAAEFAQVDAMAEAVLAHPEARFLLREQPGHSEVSVFATDPDTGVDIRARFDYLPTFEADDPWTVDLKTARDASPDGFARAAAEHRYDIQEQWYLLAYALATGDFTARMKFVAVETTPPYLVGVYPLAEEFADLGRRKVRQALETYAVCKAANIWPGYPTNPDPLQPPTWLMFQEGAID